MISPIAILWTLLITGLLGWVIDTGSRSLHAGAFRTNTLIPGFSLIFGSSAVILLLFFQILHFHPLWEILMGTIIIIAYEWLSGMMSTRILGRRLWVYKDSPYNIDGFIDLKHSLYWLILISLYYLTLLEIPTVTVYAH